jgi:deoxyribonuclease-4
MSETIRVRSILSQLNVEQKASLKKLLPSKLALPIAETNRYPSSLLSALSTNTEPGAYALLGIIAEHLLRKPKAEITEDALIAVTKDVYPEISAEAIAKVRKSKTTAPFLECLTTTRGLVETLLRTDAGPPHYEDAVRHETVEGHPDIWNEKQVFEIKLTGMLKLNWVNFLLQVFAYGALVPAVTDLYLVLPLQKHVWHADISGWKTRTEFRNFLVDWSRKRQTSGLELAIQSQLLVSSFRIGSHVKKQKTITATVSCLPPGRPWQIFLGGPQSSKISAVDSDLAEAALDIGATKKQIFVHSQYIINLCAKTDEWQSELLMKNLKYTRAFGGRGVVVHVGKSTDQPMADALEKMRAMLTRCMAEATENCPLLLETPAGQGTETLRGMTEFLDFVESFKDNRVRMCLDTCHVYACGHQPLDYIKEAVKRPGLVKLIHYNDSLGDCGSCVDRHAYVGTGKIGMETMRTIAELCTTNGLPMVIE